MTVFDGSTPTVSGWPNSTQGDTSVPAHPFDALDLLREQVEDRDLTHERVTRVVVPGIGWRLVCAIDFEYSQYKDWQKAALPRSQRNGRKFNPLDIDQTVVGMHVLVGTCEGLEYKRGDDEEQWEMLLDGKGNPATLTSSELLGRFNVVDPKTLVRKLFGSDAAIIAAGNRVAAAAGYINDDDDAGADPLD